MGWRTAATLSFFLLALGACGERRAEEEPAPLPEAAAPARATAPDAAALPEPDSDAPEAPLADRRERTLEEILRDGTWCPGPSGLLPTSAGSEPFVVEFDAKQRPDLVGKRLDPAWADPNWCPGRGGPDVR